MSVQFNSLHVEMHNASKDGGFGVNAKSNTQVNAINPQREYMSSHATLPRPLDPLYENIGSCSFSSYLPWYMAPNTLEVNEN